MSDEIKLAERLEKRANSYRFGGPSSEHTAKLLEEAAFALRTALAERDEARAVRDEAIGKRRVWHEYCVRVFRKHRETTAAAEARTEAAEARLEELTRERDEAKAALEHRDTECGYLAGKVARTEAERDEWRASLEEAKAVLKRVVPSWRIVRKLLCVQAAVIGLGDVEHSTLIAEIDDDIAKGDAFLHQGGEDA